MAIIIYILIIPFQRWQNKNIKKLNSILPQIMDIQKQYPNKEEQAQQIEPLYKSVHYFPFANIISMVVKTFVIIIMYMALLSPLVYIHGLTNAEISSFAEKGIFSHYAIMNSQSYITTYGNTDQLALTLFNLNLGYTPWQQPIWLLIPIINAGLAFLSQWINKVRIHENKWMNFIFGPLLAAVFPLIIFTRIPAILGLFWMVYSIIGFIPLIWNKYIKPIKKENVSNV